eukprot:gb/GEZN01004038.1/.p1 GENE.gb/GEZN01004038.1/~~gb/GEZN01004038.1/.p1  ORF type:complete len:552 (-),score=62.27 gb/GEZN01004038.1/:343-1998(-)
MSATEKEEKRKIGSYYIGKVIGTGATAVVRLCVHETTNKEFALKILKKEVEVKRLEAELLALQRLDHPHVVKLKDAYETSSRIWMVLELLNGEELFQKIMGASEKGLGREKTVLYFQQLVMAVKHLHERGVVHRDLKPSNIMITKQGVKLVDFGLSATVHPGKLLKTRCGSPHYVSPEVIRGKDYDGMKSDVWSLGTILFVMACGTMPFIGSNVRAVMKAITVGQYTIPPHVDSDICDLINRILKVDPDRRISVQEILDHPMFYYTKPLAITKVSSDNNITETYEKKSRRVRSVDTPAGHNSSDAKAGLYSDEVVPPHGIGSVDSSLRKALNVTSIGETTVSRSLTETNVIASTSTQPSNEISHHAPGRSLSSNSGSFNVNGLSPSTRSALAMAVSSRKGSSTYHGVLGVRNRQNQSTYQYAGTPVFSSITTAISQTESSVSGDREPESDVGNYSVMNSDLSRSSLNEESSPKGDDMNPKLDGVSPALASGSSKPLPDSNYEGDNTDSNNFTKRSSGGGLARTLNKMMAGLAFSPKSRSRRTFSSKTDTKP